MLTDFTLRNLKPRATLYKVVDPDGMYVAISPTGSISFRYDYSINGRRETLTLGRYGFGGISLAAAGDKPSAAKRLVRDGISPAIQKQREKARGPEIKTLVITPRIGSTERPWPLRLGQCARACWIETSCRSSRNAF